MSKFVRFGWHFALSVFSIAVLSSAQAAFADNEVMIPDPATQLAPSCPRLNIATLQKATSEIKNLHVVSDDLVRGAQPSYRGLQKLKEAGVKTIINLRNEEKWIKNEGRLARKLGLKYVSLPLSAFDPVPQIAIDRFLQTALSPSYQPAFVHCMRGEDRTGTMCAIYRMQKQGWGTQQAFDEAVQFGFKPFLIPLTAGVWEYGRILGHNEPMPTASYIWGDLKDRINSKIEPVIGRKWLD